MIKRKGILGFVVIFVVITAFVVYNITDFKTLQTYQVEVFKVGNGFGYQIKSQSKLLIKQDYIPAVQLNKTFCTEEDAEKVGRFVANKILNKENPKVTMENLKQLNVDLQCVNN